jgi:hypothetical protein
MTGQQEHSDRRATEWRRRGEQDARDGRFDPPADPEDRAAYEAGYFQDREITP